MLSAQIQPLIAAYGLWAVFLIVMLESAGVPMPGETALVSAAVFAGVTGDLDILVVIAVATCAAIIGDNIGFWVGRRHGLPLIRRYGRYVGLDERRLALGDLLFERHGASIVFFGRFVAFLRIFAALLAGVHKFGWGRFLLFNALGAIVWATTFGVGGYLFGDTITKLSGPLGVVAFILAVAGVIGFWWLARRKEEQYFARMEREIAARPKDGDPAP
jgi:membrane protein DedA with SNARE-associated domain